MPRRPCRGAPWRRSVGGAVRRSLCLPCGAPRRAVAGGAARDAARYDPDQTPVFYDSFAGGGRCYWTRNDRD